jgi:hypothetical protein
MTAGLSRTEITRFPHAVLDVRLKFPATHTLPSWLQVSFLRSSLFTASAGSRGNHPQAGLPRAAMAC